jgi:hypothetical protein
MSATCNGCGAPRPLPTPDSLREPCPDCGETALTYSKKATPTVRTSVSATLTLIPGDQNRGWQRRWAYVERRLASLLEPRTAPLSADSIEAAERELLSFYVDAYHLKDLLKFETSVPVEEAIRKTPELALVGDLANLHKHGRLKPSMLRSDHAPVLVRRQGTTLSGGWRLDLEIQHGADTRDGLDVARQAVDAWRQKLADWSLIQTGPSGGG